MKEYMLKAVNNTFEKTLRSIEQIDTYIHNNFKGEVFVFVAVISETDSKGDIKISSIDIFGSVFDLDDFIKRKMNNMDVYIEAYIVNLNKKIYATIINFDGEPADYRFAICHSNKLNTISIDFIAKYLFDIDCKVVLHDTED